MAEDRKLPDYLSEGDGHMDVKLERGLKVDGVAVKSMRMREPTVNDQMVFEATKGSDALKEATLIANLCDVTVDQVRSMTLRDYKRAQYALGHFIG